MLHIKDILSIERTLYIASVNSKKRALEIISESLSESVPSLNARDIFEHLIERERLGNTSIGHGIALPHARISEISTPLGCFLLLKECIDFGTDQHPQVNMIFALLVPLKANTEHIELLSTIAHLFSQDTFRQKLKHLTSREAIYNSLICA